MMFGAFTALAFFGSSPFEEYIDGWLVWHKDTSCMMSAEFEGGTFVTFVQDFRTKNIRVRISDLDWTSLGDRDGNEVRADFELIGTGIEYDQWWDESALIVADKEKKIFAVSASWNGEKYDKNFWPAWALAKGVEIKIDGRVIGGFNLAGTHKAILGLNRCAAQALKADRTDPFAD